MLSLNRKKGLSIHIGEDVQVTYLKRYAHSALLEIKRGMHAYQTNLSVNESHQVESGVSIKLNSIKGAQIRIGVQAPNHLKIYRGEVRERIEAEARALSIFEFICLDGSTIHVAAFSEAEASHHAIELKGKANHPECDTVVWAPDLLKFLENGFPADAHIFETLRKECLSGKHPPFAINLPSATEAAA